MPLTDVQIRAFQPTGKLYRVADANGLCLEVDPTGSKRWRYRYRYQGKAKMLSLGLYPAVSLRQARAARDEARRLLDEGMDPAREKKLNGTRRTGMGTFRAITDEWLATMDAKWASESSRKRVRAWLHVNIIPHIGDYLPDEVPPTVLRQALRIMEDRGAVESAQRVCSYCSQIFDYARATGRGSVNIADALRKSLTKPQKGRFATLHDPHAIGQLMREIHRYRGTAIVCFALRLMPLAFVRTIEMRRATCDEFDLTNRVWSIPKEHTKTKVPHIVPLSCQAVDIVRELFRHIDARPGKLAFPIRNGQRAISEAALLQALRNMGYSSDEMTVHGFRSMASTALNEARWNKDAVERQLSHTDKDKVRGIYNHAEYLPERTAMMQAWADWLHALRDMPQDGILPVLQGPT